ncbi:MAG: NADH-quinone oxidoreductase subunit N, partial [Actinomycetota bacterium]|nr:NADH-quinone oxidoreductase subunit N [Actinomycetota bacterium]
MGAVTAAAAAHLQLPHIDYLSILPVLIMMGGAVLVVAVSSMTRRAMGTGASTAVSLVTGIAAL